MPTTSSFRLLVCVFVLILLSSNLAVSQKYDYEAFDDIILYSYDLKTGTASATDKQVCRAGIDLAKVGDVVDDKNLGSIQVVRIIPISSDGDLTDANKLTTISSEDSGNFFCFKVSSLKEGTLRKAYKLTYGISGWKKTFLFLNQHLEQSSFPSKVEVRSL